MGKGFAQTPLCPVLRSLGFDGRSPRAGRVPVSLSQPVSAQFFRTVLAVALKFTDMPMLAFSVSVNSGE